MCSSAKVLRAYQTHTAAGERAAMDSDTWDYKEAVTEYGGPLAQVVHDGRAAVAVTLHNPNGAGELIVRYEDGTIATVKAGEVLVTA